MPRVPRAFLDASVLYPVSLRNLLMRLALAGLFQARWSADVHREWMRAVLRDHPHIPAERLERLRVAMDLHAEGALVVGYDVLIPTLKLPDDNDRHVLAAAIVGDVDLIVTHNLRDFPGGLLDVHGIEAIHPDIFVSDLIGRSPERVVAAVRDQQAVLRNPPVAMDDLLLLFERLGLIQASAALRRLLDR